MAEQFEPQFTGDPLLDGLQLIAVELGITEATVKFHVSAVYAKLEVASRAEAVSKAARIGLITL